MRKFVKTSVFILMSFFGGIKLTIAAELQLLKPTGSYSIGTKAIEIQDPSRTLFRNQHSRRWMSQLFYPSKKHEGTYPYMPDTLKDGIVQGIKVVASAKPNAECLPSQKFPLIIFIPGLGEERQKYTILCEELASQGYIVLTVDQPYVANFVIFPDNTKITLTLQDIWKMPRDRNYRYQYYDEAMAGCIKDVDYILNHLNEIDAEILENICNTNSIILMGHSFGGNVAHTLGFKDKRIKAIVDIDSKITEREIFGRIGVPQNLIGKPVLFIRGMMQYQEDVGDQLTKIQSATIWKPFVQHSAFSDQAYFAAKIEGFGAQGFLSNLINWFFKCGPHWNNIDTNLGGQEIDFWFAQYRYYIVDWLRVHLK